MSEGVVDWASKPEPWRSIGLQFVRSLKTQLPLVPNKREQTALDAGDLIRDFRRGKGWTQKALAYHAGIDWVTVNRIENARTYLPTARIREAICGALGVRVEDIWT